MIIIIEKFVHGKNGFAEVPKNLIRYSSENNFVGSSNYIEALRIMLQDKSSNNKFKHHI